MTGKSVKIQDYIKIVEIYKFIWSVLKFNCTFNYLLNNNSKTI